MMLLKKKERERVLVFFVHFVSDFHFVLCPPRPKNKHTRCILLLRSNQCYVYAVLLVMLMKTLGEEEHSTFKIRSESVSFLLLYNKYYLLCMTHSGFLSITTHTY